MKKNKSKAAYTNKWLNRNKHLWHENISHGVISITLDKLDAPKIVVERVKEINNSRLKRYLGMKPKPAVINKPKGATKRETLDTIIDPEYLNDFEFE